MLVRKGKEMKTLIQVNIEPRVGMVVEALKGRYKHHIIEFGNRFWDYDKVTQRVKQINTRFITMFDWEIVDE